MTFTITTYNVLAPAYVKRDRYPFSPKECLDTLHRIPALIEHLVELGADVLCLQEVEDVVYIAMNQRLSELGYVGRLARKGGNKPDGCATFYRAEVFEELQYRRVVYQDGGPRRPASGHVAQVLVLQVGERLLGVANTHLKWDPPATPHDRQYGHPQMQQLLSECGSQVPRCSGWIICGDLNVTMDSEIIALLREAGFGFTHADCSPAATCNTRGRAKMIDFILYDETLCVEPLPLPAVDDETPLPGPGQPSDHVAVRARIDWR